MNKALHKQFVATASEISTSLANDIHEAGPVAIPSRKHLGIGAFLARVIVGQQLSTKAAATIWGRLSEAARAKNTRIIDFCTEGNFSAIRACGVSGNKGKALLAIRSAVEDGRLVTRKLKRLSPEERNATLLEIHGVGRWTADMTAIFFFAEPDIWPDGDLSVVKVFNRYLNKRQTKNAQRYAAEFAPHRSYLAYYMWQLADAVPNE
ncbi:MAG: DNA-3-methyladenine glycosylase 2 family protein [Pseudomonadota bacterium]